MITHFKENKMHSIIMILCCAIPLIMLAVLYLTKAQGTQIGSVLSFAVILLCPLSHLVLMPLILRKKDENVG